MSQPRRNSSDSSSKQQAGYTVSANAMLQAPQPGTASPASAASAAAQRPSVPKLENSPIEVRILLEKSDTWSGFDILELERVTNKRYARVKFLSRIMLQSFDLYNSRCLVWLGITTLLRFDVHKTLGCSESTLQNWLTLIEANYNQGNTYHNATHAADVLHATACFLDSEKVKEYCDPVDEAASLVAAVIHVSESSLEAPKII